MCFSSGFDSRRPYKKALAVTRCNGMILKNVFGLIHFKMPDGILRREPEQGF